jgi:hypothetical protein
VHYDALHKAMRDDQHKVQPLDLRVCRVGTDELVCVCLQVNTCELMLALQYLDADCPSFPAAVRLTLVRRGFFFLGRG